MFLWISGQSGAGKTTLGKNLADRYGFAHFDGDIYFCGGDPIGDGGFIGSDRASDELKEQWRVVTENYEAVFDGRPVPAEDWAPGLEGLCHAAAECARTHPRLVVSFSLYSREVRRWAAEELLRPTSSTAAAAAAAAVASGEGDGDGADDVAAAAAGGSVERVRFVVLNDADGAAARRKLGQVKAAAAEQGKTMEEFVAQYGKEYKGEEHTLRELSRSQRGFEPGVEGEGEIDVRVEARDDPDAVLAKVARRLGLRDE